MQVSAVRTNAAFKAARVESPSPLISGDWQFIQDNPGQTTSTTPKEKSHWLRNTLIGIGTLAVVAGALVLSKKIPAVSRVLDTQGGIKNVQGLSQKALYAIGKAGDWISTQWGKVVNLFSTKAAEAVDDTTKLLPPGE